MTIKDCDRISGTPQMALAIRATSYLIEQGFALPVMQVNWNDRCIWCEVDGKTVGVIAWQVIEWTSTAFITVAYVIPQFRRMGIYRAMYERVVSLAKAAKLTRVNGSIHIDNSDMRKVALSMGRKEVAVVSEQLIEAGERE